MSPVMGACYPTNANGTVGSGTSSSSSSAAAFVQDGVTTGSGSSSSTSSKGYATISATTFRSPTYRVFGGSHLNTKMHCADEQYNRLRISAITDEYFRETEEKVDQIVPEEDGTFVDEGPSSTKGSSSFVTRTNSFETRSGSSKNSSTAHETSSSENKSSETGSTSLKRLKPLVSEFFAAHKSRSDSMGYTAFHCGWDGQHKCEGRRSVF